jgi:hypothetical protein
MCPQYDVQTALYDPVATIKTLQNILKNRSKLASIFMPSFPCCTDCTNCKYPYNTTSNNKNNNQNSHKNIPLVFVLNLSWEIHPPCYPLSSLKLSLEISLKLFLNVSCTLPNEFYYNLKVTLHLIQI